MNKRLRIGLIGAGTVSRHHLIAWADNTPSETAPEDNIETLRLVEDCYRLSGWEAAR